MPSAEYFRRQADICLRLSLIASDDEVSNRLITMAREYLATSDALAKEADAAPPAVAHRLDSPMGDAVREQAALGLAPNASRSPTDS